VTNAITGLLFSIETIAKFHITNSALLTGKADLRCAGFVRQKRGRKVPSSSAFFLSNELDTGNANCFTYLVEIGETVDFLSFFLVLISVAATVAQLTVGPLPSCTPLATPLLSGIATGHPIPSCSPLATRLAVIYQQTSLIPLIFAQETVPSAVVLCHQCL
jgi:hypothetical protein